jgi:hypothetical protein
VLVGAEARARANGVEVGPVGWAVLATGARVGGAGTGTLGRVTGALGAAWGV